MAPKGETFGERTWESTKGLLKTAAVFGVVGWVAYEAVPWDSLVPDFGVDHTALGLDAITGTEGIGTPEAIQTEIATEIQDSPLGVQTEIGSQILEAANDMDFALAA